jgi:alpha-tubulin suppressor-like RCC1 family protein
MATTYQGGIYTWGDNSYGQAGFTVDVAERIHRPRRLELRVRGIRDPLNVFQMVGGSTVTLLLVHPPDVDFEELDREIGAAEDEEMQVEPQEEDDVEVEPNANPSDNRPFPAGFGYVAWHCGHCHRTYSSGEGTLQCDNPDCRKQGL